MKNIKYNKIKYFFIYLLVIFTTIILVATKNMNLTWKSTENKLKLEKCCFRVK